MHHDIPHGLQADWPQMQLLARRRQGLRLLGGLGLAGALPLLGCGGGSSSDAGTTGTTGTTGSTGSTGSTGTVTSCSAIPDETAGPYPGDGSNTANGSVANVLGLGDVVRSDIRSSFGGLSGTAAGVPLTVTLTLVNSGALCASLVGYAIYLWHCGTVAGLACIQCTRPVSPTRTTCAVCR